MISQLDHETEKLKPEPVSRPLEYWYSILWHRKTVVIAGLSIVAILFHLLLRFGFHLSSGVEQFPLFAVLALGGLPLLYDLLRKLFNREFGSDLLGGISVMPQSLAKPRAIIGIASVSDAAIAGAELDDLSDDELRQRVPRIAVYARVTAEHKLRIIRAWKANEAVVAMTGDGVNDARPSWVLISVSPWENLEQPSLNRRRI
jgi:cation transport ATPase